ncbi:MAG: ribonuclease III [Litorilinea sp.]
MTVLSGNPDGPHYDGADYTELQRRLGVTFHNLTWLRQAFVHRSFVNELTTPDAAMRDNERLEFLGDAALGLVVSDIVFRRFHAYAEGELTRVRSLIVRRETLAELAQQLGLGDSLLLGKGEDESGGRERPAILCATFEAVIGAVYLDRGLDAVAKVMMPLLEQLLGRWSRESGYKDSKSRLQEWSQDRYGVAPRYKVIEQSGPDHARQFVIQVAVLQQRLGVGMGMSKQEASQRAAHMALARVGEDAPPESDEMHRLAIAWSIPDNGLDLLDGLHSNGGAPGGNDGKPGGA